MCMRHLFLALLAVPVLLAAGCGGSSPSSKSSGQNTQAQQLKYAQCMRQHGVNVSDPNQNGDQTIQNPQGGVQQMQAAEQACQKYAPNGGQPPKPSAQQQDAMIKFAQCMRNHGIPIPDPPSQPQPGGAVPLIPQNSGVDQNSPQFQQAQQACQHYLPGNPSGAGS
jgi:hypothetical protein